MSLRVSLRAVGSTKLAAVWRYVAIGGVGAAWIPALDKVWEFLQSQPVLRTARDLFFSRKNVRSEISDFPLEEGAES